MPTRKFHNEDLIELLEDNQDIDGEEFTLVSDRLVNRGRWEDHREMIFKSIKTLQVWSASYSVGTNENCDSSWFENVQNKDGFVSCPEMEPYMVTVTKYRKVKDVQQEVQAIPGSEGSTGI